MNVIHYSTYIYIFSQSFLQKYDDVGRKNDGPEGRVLPLPKYRRLRVIIELQMTALPTADGNSLLQKSWGTIHSLIRGVLIQICSAGAKNFTKYVFFHIQFNGLVKNS